MTGISTLVNVGPPIPWGLGFVVGEGLFASTPVLHRLSLQET